MNLFFTSLFPGINWKAYTKTCTRTKQCKLIADQAYQPVKITAQAAEMPSLDMWGLFEKDWQSLKKFVRFIPSYFVQRNSIFDISRTAVFYKPRWQKNSCQFLDISKAINGLFCCLSLNGKCKTLWTILNKLRKHLEPILRTAMHDQQLI